MNDDKVVPIKRKRLRDGRNPSKDELLRKESEAVALRIAGTTYEDIARALGYSSRGDVHRIVTRALSRHQAEQIDEMRNVEGARLDRAQRAIWAAVVRGDLEAVRAFVRISERRARLFGLDAPQAVQVTSDVDEQIKLLAAELASEGDAYVITELVDPLAKDQLPLFEQP